MAKPKGAASANSSLLGRPVGANSEETRQRILEATMRCVAAVGYSRTTIREIAREANMTSGSLYHYFPNKAELVKATFDEVATMRCVAAVGYSRTTIREIAREANMTSGSLYHYFPNKAELVKATFDEVAT
uniref:TetR/AcrR family transcriptional regulator n=1 Tax=Mycolicibacterium gadium TaxID=1794 RepID=UPI0021F29279